ncbi:MAG: phosphoglycerate kinase [Desulfovibrionales bacterium]
MLRMTDLDLAGRRVMIREDLNVPVQDGRVVNDRRIRAALPTIRFALEAGAGVMLVSHLGRPRHGVFDESLSLEPVAEHLSELLERPVTLVPDWLDGLSINPGQVVLLENVRFLKGENTNDPELGRRMAGLCDVFVMDAFGAAHRVQASTNAVIRSAPTACAGLLLTRELKFLAGALTQPPRPLTAVVGGSKVATALSVLESLCVKADRVILGGAVANTFLASAGVNVGRSLFEPGLVNRAEDIRNVAQDAGTMLPLPVDVVCAPDLSGEARARVKQLGQIEDGDMILDIGPQTIRKYAALLAEAATIVWNGPMGVAEHGQFCAGTRALAAAMAESPALTIAGGGETLAAIDALGIHDRLSFVSTGGGAFLKLLDGKKLPAVRLLEERAGYCLL